MKNLCAHSLATLLGIEKVIPYDSYIIFFVFSKKSFHYMRTFIHNVSPLMPLALLCGLRRYLFHSSQYESITLQLAGLVLIRYIKRLLESWLYLFLPSWLVIRGLSADGFSHKGSHLLTPNEVQGGTHTQRYKHITLRPCLHVIYCLSTICVRCIRLKHNAMDLGPKVENLKPYNLWQGKVQAHCIS